MEFVGPSRKRSPRKRELSALTILIDQPLDLPGFIFRTILLVIFIGFSLPLLKSPLDWEIVGGFWHNVNLPFHEAGHVLFGFLPPIGVSFMGTGLQLLMPIICGTTLFFKSHDPFGTAIALWWLGENFLDIAPYIADAREGTLPLLGGNTGQESPYGFHDWEFILTELKIVQYDTAIAAFSWNLGKFVMIVALLWGTILLFRAYSNRRWDQ